MALDLLFSVLTRGPAAAAAAAGHVLSSYGVPLAYFAMTSIVIMMWLQ